MPKHLAAAVVLIAGLAAPAAATTLREAAAIAGLHVGVATGTVELDAGAAGLVASEFDSVTAENDMKWSVLAPAPGTYDFARADGLVAFAEANAMRVRGHTLVWGRPNGPPSWLDAALAAAPDPSAALQDLMLNHIATVAGRYAGRVESWDVVNEPLAFSSGGFDTSSPYYRFLGPGFVADAFHAARAADPTARLFLNEVSAEGNVVKFQGLLGLVRDLLADGVPIDGVGLQGHFLTARPNRVVLTERLQAIAALGLDVEITELDIPLVLFGNEPDPLAAQAAAYVDVFSACLAVEACRGVTVWGVTDADTWLDSLAFFESFAPNRPLLFDENGLPKPAHAAVVALLAVPEPGTACALGLGLLGLARSRSRRASACRSA